MREKTWLHIKIRHNIVGVNFEKPSEIFAKLLAAIPVKIPIAKMTYPINGFIINPLMQFY